MIIEAARCIESENQTSSANSVANDRTAPLV